MTAELAIALPTVVLVLAAGLWAIAAVVVNIRCLDAARDVARAAARGESEAQTLLIGERSAPPGASIVLGRDGPDAVATVGVALRLDWPVLEAVPPVRIEARARVRAEPAEGDR